MVQYRRGREKESEYDGYGPASKIHAQRVSKIHARRDAMSGFLFDLTLVETARHTSFLSAPQSSRFQSKDEDVDLLPDGMVDPFRCYGSVWQDPCMG